MVDLSHALHEQIPMFPGLPTPEISEFLSRDESAAHYSGGTTFVIHRYQLIGNSGTYLDGPFHRYADGDDLASVPLEHCVDLPGRVLDMTEAVASGGRAIDAAQLSGLDVAGRALLVRTGWDSRWGSASYLDPNPHLTEAAAALLLERGARLVGIDSWNIDDVDDGRRPAHSLLLRAGVPVIENLRGLERLPAEGFRFHAAPLPIRAGSATPVRAYAVVGGETI